MALQRLFAQAVRDHFDYFAPAVQQKIIADHSLSRLAKAMVDSRRVILVARTPEKLIGYAVAATSKTGLNQLFWLYVDPDFRGANTGLSLLSRSLKHLRAKGAHEVWIATHDYRKYYERQGFTFIRKDIVHGAEMDILSFNFREQ